MNRIAMRGLLMTSALCSATLAWGQEATEDGFLGTLRITSPDAQALLGNDTITEEEIRRRNPSTTKDVFRGESSVTASGGAAIGQKVFVNGIEESLLSVTIDGARQNKSAFHHTGNVLLDPELLKRVEVSEGLAAADAGPGALAGSLAYETKDAADLLDPGDTFGGSFKLGTDSNGGGFQTSLALYGITEGGFEFVLSTTRRKSDSYSDGAGAEVVGTGADLTDYIAKFAQTFQGGHRLEFAASQTKDTGLRAAQAGPGGILFIRPDFFGIVGGTTVLVEGLSERNSFTLTYTNEQPEGFWDSTIQLSYNEQIIDAIGVYGENTSFSGTFKNDFAISGGILTAGFDFFNETASGFGRGPGPFGSSGQDKHRNFGVFAQARQDLGERVSLSYGARYDWQVFDAADGTEFTGSGASVNGSIDYVVTDTLTLNAGIASSWGGYELGEAALVNFGGAWDYTGFTTSRANAARVGLRFDNGTIKAGAALFHTDVKDINAVLPRGGARGATSDLTSKGIDASLEYTWASGFARMNVTHADVKLNDATIGSTAYYLGRPVGTVIGLEAGWVLGDQWRVGGVGQIALESTDTAITLPSYEVVDLYATYVPRGADNIEVRFDVFNLFDATYSGRSSDGIDSTRVIPLNEPGRTFGITTRIRF
ncbi:MAG: TonB-dependent receptor [Pseudomonadota bacterium]